jgi:hypothetical protein
VKAEKVVEENPHNLMERVINKSRKHAGSDNAERAR